MRKTWHVLLVGMALLGTMAAVPARADEGGPPDGPRRWNHRPELSAEQQTKMQALRTDFEHKREADKKVFETQIRGVLTKDQVARLDQREAGDKRNRDAFKKGEDEARSKLKASGQPVPEAGAEDVGPVSAMGFPPGPLGGPPPFIRPHEGPMGRGPGFDGAVHDLNLSPEQMGQVQVFRQSFEAKGRTEMRDMFTKMRAIAPPPPRGSDGPAPRGSGGPPPPRDQSVAPNTP